MAKKEWYICRGGGRMKRLTIYRDGALEINCENCPETKICKSAELTESDCLYFLTERLAEYEDMEEQGLLLRLPCKVGDTVYDISEFVERTPYAEMYEFHADYIGIGKSDDGRTVISIDCMDYYMDDFGKIVFTSREEAEKALED